MWNFDKIAKECNARGQMMPSTTIRGYSSRVEFNPMGELTDEQVEACWDWYVSRVNEMLPEYAEWIPSTSEIILPIDKLHDLDAFFDRLSWDDLLNEVYEKFVKNCDAIIGENKTEEE